MSAAPPASPELLPASREQITAAAAAGTVMLGGAVEGPARATGEHLRLALAATGLGTWDFEPLTGALRWDARCKELFGLPPETEVDYPMFLAGLHPEDRDRVAAIVARSLDPAGGGHYDTEFRTVGAADGGVVRWLRATGHAYFNAHGQAERFIGTIFDVTTRKQAEEALRESEARFRQLADVAPTVLWTTDPAGQCTFLSRGWYEFTGQPAGSGLGLGWTEAIHPADRANAARAFLTANARREFFSVDYRVCRADGEYRWAVDAGRPYFDDAGEFLGLVGTVSDIHERKEAETALRERSRLIALRADTAALLTARVDADAGPDLQGCCELLVEHLDAAFARIWTLEEGAQTLVLRASAGLYTHLDGPHGRVTVGEFKIGRIAQSRQALLTNDVAHDPNISDPEWAQREGMTAFAGYPLVAGGEVLGVLALFSQHALSEAVLTDLAPIAESVAQCLARQRAQAALERSEATARFLAQASADLAEVTDPQSTLQKIASTAVPAFTDWCTVDLAKEDGSIKRVAVTHADPEKVRASHEVFEKFPPRTEDAHGVLHVLRTGKSEWFEGIPDFLLVELAHDDYHLSYLRALGLRSYLSVPMRSRGRSLGVLTFIAAESGRSYTEADLRVAEDLAQRAAIAIENATLYHELREADRHKDEFLATLAHELRNPLAPIRNALHLLEECGGPDAGSAAANFAETRGLMERQLNQMVRLVDDLFDVSRITRGTIDLRRQPATLAAAVRAAVEISQAPIADAGHTLRVELPPPGEPEIPLDADPVRLAQVISNLLNNSARYTERGGHITLSAAREGDRAVVRVRDDGIGIAPGMLPRIFDMFTQADRSLERAQSGLGIGLTLVKRLVEMHGGTVEARSAGLGQGSEFTVRLPVADGRAAALPPSTSPAPADGRQPPREAVKRRILVVDDNRDAATTLAKLLGRLGNDVQTAFDGLEAVASAAAFRPEVVLLDIGLPGLNGYDAATRIREQTAADAAPPPTLIALTGWGQEDDRARARQAGFDHHFVKPVDFERLKALLADIATPS